jgi:hypothetical protein
MNNDVGCFVFIPKYDGELLIVKSLKYKTINFFTCPLKHYHLPSFSFDVSNL